MSTLTQNKVLYKQSKPSKKMGLLSELVPPGLSNWSYLLELRNKEEQEISVSANSLFFILNAKTNGFLQVPFVSYAWGKLSMGLGPS